MSKVFNKNYIGEYGMKYGIYTIQSESEIPQNLIKDKYTFYVKINGKNIKDYYLDYLDIMQNAFEFHTKDCVGWRDRYLDWMSDLSWLYYSKDSDTGYKNIVLVFEHWNAVGKGWFSSGEKVREMILEDFIESGDYDNTCGGILRQLDFQERLKVFNIYLIP